MKYDFNIIIKRTNRKKTVSFRIKNQEVIISVPKFLSDNEIYNLVEIKIKWIKNKLSLEKLNNVSIKRKYENGDIFLYLGSEYSLKIKKSHKDNIYIKDKIYPYDKLKGWKPNNSNIRDIINYIKF